MYIKNKKRPFNHSYIREVVGYLAFLVFAKTTELATVHFSQLNLTTKEGMIIEFVANNPSASQADIAREAGMKASLLVKILDDLTDRNLLIRQPSPTDRRRHHLRLTDAGEQLREQIRACHLAGNNELFTAAGLTAKESETLVQLLHKLTDHIQERSKEGK